MKSDLATIYPAHLAPSQMKALVGDPLIDVRAFAVVPSDAIAGWKPDAYEPGMDVPVWATGWSVMERVVQAIDACADPIFVRLKDGRALVVGRD